MTLLKKNEKKTVMTMIKAESKGAMSRIFPLSQHKNLKTNR